MMKVSGPRAAIGFAGLSFGMAYLSVPAAVPAPLVAAKSAEDLGVIRQGRVVKHTFDLVNRGAGAVAIRTVLRNCDCATVNVGRATVEPGGHCPVEVAWDTKERVGPAFSTVRVVYAPAADLASTAEVELRLAGDVAPPVRYTPARLSFDPTAPAPQVRTVEVAPEPGEEGRVVEAVANHPALATEVVDGHLVRIKFDPAAWDGVAMKGGASLFVKTTNPTAPDHVVRIDCETPRERSPGL